VGTSPMIYTNQHQHWIERHRTKRIRGHTVNFAVLVHGDDRDPGGETSHGLAKIARGETHAAKNPFSKKHCRAGGEAARPAIAYIYQVRRSANWI
jgi:hypothetical protein